MKIQTNLLKPYEFNKEFFEDIKGDDYEGLKEDIKQNGIKVELHVTKSNMILCGHQRWNIAKEIGLNDVPIKVVHIDEKDELKVKEYVIKDNLLRRHLTLEQKYLLIGSLSEVNEVGRRGRTKEERLEDANLTSSTDVLTKTAKDVGVGERTVARARKYKEIVSISPELKGKKALEVINNYEVKENKVVRKNTQIELDLNKLNQYDNNMFYFSGIYSDKRFGDDVVCVDANHGEDDIREYKEYYPTVTTMSRFFDNNGKEFSLRKYADVQNFPKSFKFVGTSGEIKKQIGNAVSPKMAEYIINKYIKGKKYIELFAGCGGFSVGAEKLGKECVWCNDFDKYAGYSFKLNFPDTEVYIGDIIECDEKKIHTEVGDVDFIIGGPSCQGFSSAGKRLGFKEDSRNQLYLDYLRFVKEFKPKQFIMENVKEILEHKDEVIKDFEKIGYSVETELVNGLDIKMKQKRIRAFFIGNRK